MEQVEERKIVYKVTSKGKKTKRIKCRPGYKLVDNRCVKIQGAEKVAKRKAIRQAIRTKKADLAGKKRAVKKRLKAMKKRKSYGL